MEKLIVNEDLRKWITPLTSEEYSNLEKSLKTEGCRDAIIKWMNPGVGPTIIDGHNRYDLCTKHGVEFTTTEMFFNDIEDVKDWIDLNQLSRRNLTDSQREIVIGRRYNREKKKQGGTGTNQYIKEQSGKFYHSANQEPIAEKQAETKVQLIVPSFFNEPHPTHAPRPSGFDNSPKSYSPPTPPPTVKTEQRLAEEYKISPKTVRNYGNIATKFEQLQVTNPRLAEEIFSGKKTFTEVKKEEKKQAVINKIEQYKEEIKQVSSFDIDIFNTDKKFNIIYADPAWQYWDGGEKNQSLHYQTMTIDEICRLPISKIADQNCILFIWITFPILQESLKVIESWGFKYSTCGFVWVKKNKVSDSWFFGNGSWTRANSELCIIATKGSITRIDAGISQVLDDRIMEHSKKPERVRGLITKLVGELPRIELFSRNQNNDGWYNWGNQI